MGDDERGKLVGRALELYEIKPRRIFGEQKGYRNRSFRIETEDGDLNLIFYKSEEGILERVRRVDELAERVYEAGLPVRHIYDARILEMVSGNGRKHYARLYYYLAGETIAWEMFSMNHIKALGWAMSDLHGVMREVAMELPNMALPNATEEMVAINERMRRYFGEENVARAMREKLGVLVGGGVFDEFGEVLERVGKMDGRQPLHLDLVRGNLLFRSSPLGNEKGWRVGSVVLSGIIDFEKAAMGHRILDLARTMAFLAVDVAAKTPEKIYRYLVKSGYEKRGGSRVDWDGETFADLVKFFMMYDFYKFLRHNPYEFLGENRHYLRTRDLLMEKSVLEWT